jgi:cell division protein ZapB
MENELNALEGKLLQLIQVCGSLRMENHRLHQELAHSQNSNRQYQDQLEHSNKNLAIATDRLESAKLRLNNLLITLPEDQL